MTTSPLAPAVYPELPEIAGVRCASAYAAIRYKTPRPDVLLMTFDEGTVAAGVWTTSLTASAPVLRGRKALAEGKGSARVLVVNSGNSNAFTGQKGEIAVDETVKAASALVGCGEHEVFVASTGVIGEPLPYGKITAILPELYANQRAGAWEDAAKAILTTDTYAKYAEAQAVIDGVPVKIAGIAKGSGMIAPNMATMLAFVFTDAAVEHSALQEMLEASVDESFNAITVDSDTSTSDTLMLFATGKAGNAPFTAPHPAFLEALNKVTKELAHLVVKDGEGATKFIEIEVAGAEHKQAARKIGLAIANSPLVKTAIAGEDANWGRIVMAVGKSGERAERDRLCISIGGIAVARNGEVVEGYDEAPVAKHMKGEHIRIAVDVGVGNGKATVWTCDLTKRYIEINADYRS